MRFDSELELHRYLLNNPEILGNMLREKQVEVKWYASELPLRSTRNGYRRADLAYWNDEGELVIVELKNHHVIGSSAVLQIKEYMRLSQKYFITEDGSIVDRPDIEIRKRYFRSSINAKPVKVFGLLVAESFSEGAEIFMAQEGINGITFANCKEGEMKWQREECLRRRLCLVTHS